MPYRNIVFAKLEKRLLNDPRWYMMSEISQLNYIKLILFASETSNRIPVNLQAIRKGFKTDQTIKTLEKSLKEIENSFPKFQKNGEFYYFEDFHEKTNYIRDCPSIAQVLPKAHVDKDKDKEEDKEEDKIKREIIIMGEREIIIKDYFIDLLPIDLKQPQIEAWVEWVDFRKAIKKKLVKPTAQKQINFLLKQPNMIECINKSIEKGWQGLFEVNNERTEKHKGNSGYQSKLAEEGRGNTGRKFDYITSGDKKNEG
jgi:hypothetical protein